MGLEQSAAEHYRLAQQLSPDYVFPFQWEAEPVLRFAIQANPRDGRAPYYLGNLLYDWRPDDAIKLWEQAAQLDPSFAIVQRNLAIAYARQDQPAVREKAMATLEKAVAATGRKYAMHFTELDELYEETGKAPAERLALFEANHDIVCQRDDSLAREISLKVVMGKYDDAIRLLTGVASASGKAARSMSSIRGPMRICFAVISTWRRSVGKRWPTSWLPFVTRQPSVGGPWRRGRFAEAAY
jgi:tetratricopeptide (TPR) repeat protein